MPVALTAIALLVYFIARSNSGAQTRNVWKLDSDCACASQNGQTAAMPEPVRTAAFWSDDRETLNGGASAEQRTLQVGLFTPVAQSGWACRH